MNKLTTTLLVFGLLFIVSCNDDTSENNATNVSNKTTTRDNNLTSRSTLNGIVGGAPFEATVNVGGSLTKQKVLTFSGWTKDSTESILIKIWEYEGKGTYTHNDQSGNIFQYTVQKDKMDVKTIWSTNSRPKETNSKLTVLEQTERGIKGTFSFTARHDDDAPLEITDGTFDIVF